MAGHRNSRISGEIQRELAEIITREVKDPRLKFVTVMAVNLSSDGSYARVYISPGVDSSSKEDIAKALDNAKGFIRHSLGQKLKARVIPELQFTIDESIEYGIKMSKIIERQIQEDEVAAANRPLEQEGIYKD